MPGKLSYLEDIDRGFHSIFWGSVEITDALRFLESQQPVFLGQLAELLNDYHGWNRSTAYYDLLCGDWLMQFSHVLYAAYQEVMRGNSPSLDHRPFPVFSDRAEFLRANVYDFSFNNQIRELVSEVLDRGKAAARAFVQGSTTCGDETGGGARRRILNSLVQRIGKRRAPFVFCNPYIKCSPMEWVKTLYDWRGWARQESYSYPVAVRAQLDVDWRRNESFNTSIVTFLDVFRTLLPIYLPVVYLEGFAAYRQQVFNLKLPRPRVIYTASSLHGHILFKTLAADWREEGTKILNHQHGGGYGLGLIEPNESYEIRLSDRFYTSGWTNQIRKVKPLAFPMPIFSRKSGQSVRVLLTLLAMPRYVYRIQFAGMPGTNELMISKTVDFVQKLNGKAELVVRASPNDYGCGMVNSLLRVNPNLHFDDLSVSGMRSFFSSALVVHNYLGSSWLETLAMNIPTVCFYDRDVYVFRDAAQPYIDGLAAVGILHQDGEAAARFVLKVMDDPHSWWQKPEVQSARQLFVSRYANFSPDWRRQWEVEFFSWIN
ncbi:MAG: hypothetical protein HY272_11585 [Gammaproteobacteria bacterium]|nr:hypothetical protein [Gammaproteobacteria bacterium]